MGEESVEVHSGHIERSATQVGLCKPDLPWLGPHTSKRIKVLRGRLESCRTDYEQSTLDEQRSFTKDVLGDIRALVERTVEREFLGDIVKRFDNYIRVSKLWKASVFSETDADNLHRLYRKCSTNLRAHDSSPAGQVSPHTIDELVGLLDDLEGMIQKVRLKQETLKNQRDRTWKQSQKSTYKPSI